MIACGRPFSSTCGQLILATAYGSLAFPPELEERGPARYARSVSSQRSSFPCWSSWQRREKTEWGSHRLSVLASSQCQLGGCWRNEASLSKGCTCSQYQRWCFLRTSCPGHLDRIHWTTLSINYTQKCRAVAFKPAWTWRCRRTSEGGLSSDGSYSAEHKTDCINNIIIYVNWLQELFDRSF
jgi:hypothetical protein